MVKEYGRQFYTFIQEQYNIRQSYRANDDLCHENLHQVVSRHNSPIMYNKDSDIV